MLLVGLAMENLFKGAIVPYIADEEREAAILKASIPRSVKSHNLRHLATLVSLETNAQEEVLLGRLSKAVLWHGRYPVATEFHDGLDTLTLADGRVVDTNWLGEKDTDACEALLVRVRTAAGARPFQPPGS
jgi:hypothetical protein